MSTPSIALALWPAPCESCGAAAGEPCRQGCPSLRVQDLVDDAVVVHPAKPG